jgi:hypothetical protein
MLIRVRDICQYFRIKLLYCSMLYNKVILLLAIKAYGDLKVQLHGFSSSLVDGGKRSASRPNCFTPEDT